MAKQAALEGPRKKVYQPFVLNLKKQDQFAKMMDSTVNRKKIMQGFIDHGER